ncbi:hypothetical protein AMECASPLE_018903 [Ameca splendens]|uniref:Uncharacterized protein n=1 Tax=Ameca splendens TaxID=208324 RepID=A0ABV0XS49_9TELE
MVSSKQAALVFSSSCSLTWSTLPEVLEPVLNQTCASPLRGGIGRSPGTETTLQRAKTLTKYENPVPSAAFLCTSSLRESQQRSEGAGAGERRLHRLRGAGSEGGEAGRREESERRCRWRAMETQTKLC